MNFKGISYSIVGDEKKSSTSLKRQSGSSTSGFSKLNFNVKIPKLNDSNGSTFSFTPKKLIKNRLRDLIKLKPKLVDLSSYQNLGFQSSLVGYEETSLLLENLDKPMSPRLMNWVEPYLVSGLRKTLFYTEVNSGLKVGDRVFIIGGNYDSDELIKSDKYKEGRDGYKVLYVDKCQVVLDIDYTGVTPWQQDDDDNFMRLHFINNIDDFVSVEKAITTRGGQFDRKFNKYQNNIIYTNKNYGPITVWGNQAKLVEAPGFFVRTPLPILSVDGVFNVGSSGFNIASQVYDIVRQPDGKLIVGGSFTSYNGISANRIIRLNPSGTIDSSFNVGSGFDGIVETIGLQSNGKIIIGGRFTTFNGSSPFASRMIRLNTNGSVDNTFSITIAFIPGAERINKLLVVPSGPDIDKIYIVGNFTNVSGITRKGIARLQSNGTTDAFFNPGIGFEGVGVDLVKTLALQSDGKLIAGGSFTKYRGLTFRKIVRILTNGVQDATNFSSWAFGNNQNISVYSIEVQTDGKILVGGNFTSYFLTSVSSQQLTRIGRFTTNCTLDTSFNIYTNLIGLDNDVRAIKFLNTNPLVPSSGEIFLGGNFLNNSKLIHLKSDGSLGNLTPQQSGFNFNVYKIITDSNNQLIVGGDFTFYNSVPVRKIAKLEEGNWINITNKFISGSFSDALSPTYYNNGKVKVFNGSFTYSINEPVTFKKDYVYTFGKAEEPNNFQGTYSTWKVDVKYLRPIITKTNFRDGNFDGTWNVGLFGRHNKQITWEGNVSKWNTGTLLNTRWLKGDIKTTYSLAESYYTELDNDGFPSQKLNGPNNNGRGFNFIIDSNLLKSKIDNGSFYDANIGSDSTTYTVVEKKILNSTFTPDIEVKKGYFDNSVIKNGKIKNSEIRTSNIINTDLDNIKTVNSYFKKSYVKNSDYISDTVIKILGYDELNMNVDSTYNTPTHKVYKFYIRKSDYYRLNQGDYFYLRGVDIVDGQKKLLNFFDKKFKLTHWYEYDDVLDGNDSFYKRGIDAVAFLSTPEENSFRYTTVRTINNRIYTEITDINPNKNYSIDIIFSIRDKNDLFVSGLDFNRSSVAFQLGNSVTILAEYTDNLGIPVSKVIAPSGYYAGKPYYIIENSNLTTILSYIFFSTSQNRWENWEGFNPSTGLGSGNLLTFLQSTSYLPVPDGSTFSIWVTVFEILHLLQSTSAYNPTAQLPSLIGNIVNTTNGYVIDSDFESGFLERSNWNSGSYINLNNDANITINSNSGGFYDIDMETSTDTLLVTTTIDINNREMNQDCLSVGDVVFLNSVFYDTSGKILNFVVVNNGLNYIDSSQILLTGGSGTGATVDIEAAPVGSVLSVSIINGGNGYYQGPPAPSGAPANVSYINIPTTPLPGCLGTGLTVDIFVGTLPGFGISEVCAVTINNPGIGYVNNDQVTINGNPTVTIGFEAVLEINNVTDGDITSVSLNLGGIQYSVGDVLTIPGGNGAATIQVLSTTGSKVKLPDTYKITNRFGNNQYRLKEVTNTTTALAPLLDGGLFFTEGANNRYGYLHQTKFIKNNFKSGFLKRAYVKENLFKNFDINLQDRDFNNILLFKNLLLSDILFTDNLNILSKASYVQSIFSNGTDYWDEGLLYNSVWNGGLFRQGLIKESSWHDGIFRTGLFYQSRSFNANPNFDYQFYDVDRIKNYWKDGPTSPTISNDRYSWRGGTFSAGEFLKSDWEKGLFVTGKLWNSKWYAGTFSSGTIGDKSISFNDTWFYNGLVKTAIVENAALYGIDTSFYGLSSSNIVWETGTFNDGIFGCDILIQQSSYHTALWKTGTFNGGEFRTNGKWLTGVFNGGKFISGFGWTQSPTINQMSNSAADYAWETGEFNNGEFGDRGFGTNSTWWSGEFNGGLFQGRIWNDGIFTSGRFRGSGPVTPVGGYSVDAMTQSNASLFVDSFSQSFYGIWRGGFVSDVKDEFTKDKKLFTLPVRSVITKVPKTIVDFESMLWLGGTFSHPGGKVNKSVWIDGQFIKGKFESGSFNPWVIRPNETNYSFNINDDLVNSVGSCIWEDGVLKESDFYISQWKKGQFISGTAFGMVWKDGVTNYMNAYNVFWENGTWRNGNWNGSYFVFDGDITPPFNKQIIFRGMNWADTPNLHIWNVFTEEVAESSISIATASSIDFADSGQGGGPSE
jgi:uncharacterized delta-60 repeat protein